MVQPPVLHRISDYTAWHAARSADEVALVLEDQRVTFGEVHDRVEALARALLAAGVGKGDRVATLQTPCPDYFIAFLATASIGAIWVGLNPKCRLPELLHVVTDSEPSVMLVRATVGDRYYGEDIAALREACPAVRHVVAFEQGLGDGAESLGHGVVSMASFLAAGAAISGEALAAARAGCGDRDPCLLVYTSGSTGAPKGALLHHHGVIQAAHRHNAERPVSRRVQLNYYPINHIGCVVDVSIPVFVSGGKLVFLEHFDAVRALELIGEEGVTVWTSVPSTFHLQLALPDFARFDLSSVELIAWGGAAMPREAIERLRSIRPRMTTNYGLTESTTVITNVSPTDDVEILSNSVGLPLPGVEVRLVGPDGAIVPQGEPGEVQTRSSHTFLGYWRRPDATADAFTADGWFRTGDQALQRPDGRYRIVGRLKEMYKSGGYNVYPREIEVALEAHPAVAAAAVVSIPDPLWQEVGVAYILPQAEVSPEELIAFCRERLANYKVPKRIVLRPDMPLLPIGKIDKNALKNEARQEN
ncbi:class I adenylate-forming enzyme family protein [Sphingomonas sp. TX0543]|uniref:class I adenylate-forming enzyme family protein n=1 Tax=unclassified Sphingomonas TaxID=196159 RepID=UPI0010F7AD5D|nr:class I adenylate-forming enzyme family protein [Sphingomonas sp. 3P27F8]